MILINTLRSILNHPLNRNNRAAALKRYVCWQLGSRLVPGDVLVPFVNETYLVVSPGMTGATMNVYTGLADLSDCGLLLHLLRPEDLFVDIGANVGVYTVLAAAVVGASAITFEPVPTTFMKLLANLRANNIQDNVSAYNIGLGRENVIMRFTADRDTQNRIISDPEWQGSYVEVSVRRLDDVLTGKCPTLLKIDVEGWESEVLAGGAETLKTPALLGVIVEMMNSCPDLNANERSVYDCLKQHGFLPYSYNALTRKLNALPSKNLESPNTIFLRHAEEIHRRVLSAPTFRVQQHCL